MHSPIVNPIVHLSLMASIARPTSRSVTPCETMKGLLSIGATRGDRIAILMGNRAEWLIAYFATMTIGAEVVALNDGDGTRTTTNCRMPR